MTIYKAMDEFRSLMHGIGYCSVFDSPSGYEVHFTFSNSFYEPMISGFFKYTESSDEVSSLVPFIESFFDSSVLEEFCDVFSHLLYILFKPVIL